MRDYMDEPVIIVVNPNGPLRVTGNFVIKDAQGKDFGLAGRTVISLCRCGQSQNKPFCDGSHARTGFQSIVEARELPPPAPKP
jgi:CDGSH-type Zn-finger protein